MPRFLSLLCCLSMVVFASPSMAGNEEQASKYIENLAGKTLEIIQTKQNRDVKKDRLEKLFAGSVDIDWVGKFVMGRYWHKATDDQKKRYLKAYRDFVIGHYATRFSEYSSGKFTITGTSKLSDEDEYLINMQLDDSGTTNGEPVLVDYKVRKAEKSFLVFDVIIEGVSMITTQRSEFASVITRNGLDYLIDQLANKSMPLPAS